jgi:hypothetical protein
MEEVVALQLFHLAALHGQSLSHGTGYLQTVGLLHFDFAECGGHGRGVGGQPANSCCPSCCSFLLHPSFRRPLPALLLYLLDQHPTAVAARSVRGPPLPAFIKPACLHRLPSAIELSWSETTHPINRASPPLVVPPQTLRSFIDKARLSVRPRTGEPLHTRALAIINHSP